MKTAESRRQSVTCCYLFRSALQQDFDRRQGLAFEHFEEWVKTQPADRDPMHPDMSGLSVVNIDMDPGDLMIFNSLLAHGVRPNHSDGRVRMAQYIAMHPADHHAALRDFETFVRDAEG